MIRPRRYSSCRARATVDRGSSGIDIQGARPTSPRAWEILCQTLEDQKVSPSAHHLVTLLAATICQLNQKLCAHSQVSFITPQETVFAQQRGVPIIDVRPAFDHYCSRIPGSVGIPFMRAITGKSDCTWACLHIAQNMQTNQ